MAGVTVTFTAISGPNLSGIVCSETGNNANVTDSNGNAPCTCTDTEGAGTDTIQANSGALTSNTVSKTWQAPCDLMVTKSCQAAPEYVCTKPITSQTMK